MVQTAQMIGAPESFDSCNQDWRVIMWINQKTRSNTGCCRFIINYFSRAADSVRKLSKAGSHEPSNYKLIFGPTSRSLPIITHGVRTRRREDIVDWLVRVLYKLEYYDHGLLAYAGVITLLEKHE